MHVKKVNVSAMELKQKVLFPCIYAFLSYGLTGPCT